MRLPFDECVPEALRKGFVGYIVATVEEAGFKGLKNGALLRAAVRDFEVLVTVDQGFEHQQNLHTLPISVLLLRARTNDIDELELLIPDALDALKSISDQEFIKISNSSLEV